MNKVNIIPIIMVCLTALCSSCRTSNPVAQCNSDSPRILTSGTLGFGEFECAIPHGGTNKPIVSTWSCGEIAVETIPPKSTTHWITTIGQDDCGKIIVQTTNNCHMCVSVYLDGTNMFMEISNWLSTKFNRSVYRIQTDPDLTPRLMECK